MLRLAIQIAICFVFISSPLLTASYFMSSSNNAKSESTTSFNAKGLPLVFMNTGDSKN